ncbi:Lysophospholipase D gdpd1 [Boothiomyces sp. JEL0838]|nr:Lysophospholipase D gdpd1 [Boothiomyces sp. JEL0838]
MSTAATLVIIATTSFVGYQLLRTRKITKMNSGLPFPHTYMSHRGGSREWVENTLPGFRYSASINADILEMDVQMTKDGKIVVFHDNTLEKMCGLKTKISDYDFKDLPKLIIPKDLQDKKEVVQNPDSYRIPLFEVILKEFPNSAMQIDCKNGPEELVIQVGKLIQHHKREKITVWGSFKPSINDMCYKHFGDSIPLFFDMYRGFKSVMLYKLGLLNIMEFRESALICPDMTLFADKGYVKAMNSRGVSVIYFGSDGSGALNDPAKWERARSLGANGICSDKPTELKEWLKSHPLDKVEKFLARAKSQQHSSIPDAALQVINAAKNLGIDDVSNFYSVESDYYEWPLEQRKERLEAPSVDHLCKSLLFENTRWRPKDGQDNELDHSHPKYILVVVQYTDKINNKKLNLLMKEWGQQSAKAINMRIAPEEMAIKLTGYGNNGVTPIGMLENVPVLVTENIAKLDPPVLFLGGGHVDWKIALPIDRFTKVTNAKIVDLGE